MFCNFLEQFKKLRKSSVESVVDSNDQSIDDLKKYIHIVRDVELNLRDIIEKTNDSGKKTLVLVCGSAGDGKSHLLSIMKDSNLLENYSLHNDATESFIPTKSSI